MDKQSDFSFPKMKADIVKAGNCFYQYRACKRDAATIYDIENIRHGVVYARTPLQMNDPFDSMIGFSVEEIYNECIDLALNQVDSTLDSNLKLVMKTLLQQRLLGQTLEFISTLNALKKYIFRQSLISHVAPSQLVQFIATNLSKLYSKCPSEIKKFLNKDSFLVFSLIIKDYQNVDIEEKTLIDALKMEEVLKELETTVIEAKDKIYVPFLKDFLSKLTVTCFSASGWDNQLMWSHYANSYSGICVEYDFEKMNDFVGFMYPVKYSSIRPTVSLKDLGLSSFKKDENGRVELWTYFYADYLMGDTEYDYFDDEAFEPAIYYYDADEEWFYDEETLAAQGVKLISFEYPTPIKNSFVFSHISILSGEVVLPALLISLLALIATIIFVKKDKSFVRQPIDVVSTVFNFVIGVALIPYCTIIAIFLDIAGDNDHILNQMFYFIPALIILCITASVALRRKDYKKSALVVEFVGPVVFALFIFSFLIFA